MLSSPHAELIREQNEGHFHWCLRDRDSRFGSYVRIRKALVCHNQQVLIGGHRFRFDDAPGANPGDGANAPRASPWETDDPLQTWPTLVELTRKGEGERFAITRPEIWVGRNANLCSVALRNDPFVSPRHARFYRNPKGRWKVEDVQSLNGTWLRISEVTIDTACEFQLGEQRFMLRIL
jgi:pSer/pThr/pTyr-binding forkhead associated (FHA) protein